MKFPSMALAVILLSSCTQSKKPDEQAFLDSLDSAQNQGSTIDSEVIENILDQIPSPLEVSVLLKESGRKYSPSLLNSPDSIHLYNSNFKKALNLGIYGTDLGYTNIYKQNQESVRYLSSVKSLADELNIGQFFDIETISRLATTGRDLDSLLLITTQNFNTINQYLQAQSRSNLSALLLTGGWVEAVHITCQIAAKDLDHKELKEKIGEQKITLKQILLLFSFYQNDPSMESLLRELEELKLIFDKISITYTYAESTMEVVDSVAIIQDNSTTTIEITNQDVIDIMNKINSMRSKIIS